MCMIIERIFMKKLKEILKKRNLSANKLEKMCGIQRGNIIRIMNGKQEPYFETMVKIADALDISLDEFR